ncbi:GNAT family N-acetyltransferase [Prauserella oleivorans]
MRGAHRADVPGEAGVTVRRATEADTGEAVALWLAELRYSALVGPATVRPGAADRLAAEFRRAVRAGEPVWLAEADGVPVGVAVCAWPAPIPHRIADGLWARVGTVSVAPAARGTGIGRTLMATAHRELVRDRARGAYLFYSPHNALSTVFWHRQGYRPLWTVWEVRPATALR